LIKKYFFIVHFFGDNRTAKHFGKLICRISCFDWRHSITIVKMFPEFCLFVLHVFTAKSIFICWMNVTAFQNHKYFTVLHYWKMIINWIRIFMCCSPSLTQHERIARHFDFQKRFAEVWRINPKSLFCSVPLHVVFFSL